MHLGRMIKILNTTIERDMNRTLAKFDLTGGQGAILGYLVHHPEIEICQKDLEKEFELSHPTMSSIVARMEAKGIVSTEALEKDRRFKKIVLTEKGKALDREVFSFIEENDARLMHGFSEEEKQKMIELLYRMMQNVNA